VTFSRWSEAEAAIDALNGSFQYPSAKAKVVVKFADAKPEGAARPGEKRPQGSDMGQVRRSGNAAAAAAAAMRQGPLAALAQGAAGACRRLGCAMPPPACRRAPDLHTPQGPNKKAFTAGLAMGSGFGPYGRGGMGLAGFGLGMGGPLGLNPMVRCCLPRLPPCLAGCCPNCCRAWPGWGGRRVPLAPGPHQSAGRAAARP
jgi:hypothetical protein